MSELSQTRISSAECLLLISFSVGTTWQKHSHHKRGSKSRLKFQFSALLPLFMPAHKTGKRIPPNKRLTYLRKTVRRSTVWNMRSIRYLVVNVEIAMFFDKTGLIVWYKGAIISDRLPAASIVNLYGGSHLSFFQTYKFNRYAWVILHQPYILNMEAEGFYWSVGNFLSDYTPSHLRKRQASDFQVWNTLSFVWISKTN